MFSYWWTLEEQSAAKDVPSDLDDGLCRSYELPYFSSNLSFGESYNTYMVRFRVVVGLVAAFGQSTERIAVSGPVRGSLLSYLSRFSLRHLVGFFY